MPDIDFADSDETSIPEEDNTQEQEDRILEDHFRKFFNVDELQGIITQAMQESGHTQSCQARVHVDESKCNCWVSRARAIFRL